MHRLLLHSKGAMGNPAGYAQPCGVSVEGCLENSCFRAVHKKELTHSLPLPVSPIPTPTLPVAVSGPSKAPWKVGLHPLLKGFSFESD